MASPAVDFGHRVTVLGVAGWSVLVRWRVLLVCLGLVAGSVVVSLFALASGDFRLTVPQVVDALAGQGSRAAHMVVVEWRLPRVLLGLVFGAALGLGGAIFQSLTRNPLGSPDVIGFSAGSYTGGLIVIIAFHGSYLETAAGSVLGGLLTAVAVYFLAYKNGVQGFRLIIVGIAISAMLASVDSWLIVTADLAVAMLATVWGVGSLNGLGWEQAGPAVLLIAVLVGLLVPLARRMAMLELGDDAARALGVRVEPTRLALVVLGVGLTAVVTAAAGPIAFVALAAPQLARRVARTAGVSPAPAAAMGAVLLVTADWVAQRAFAPTQLPVGIVTVSIGGVYLIWLLVMEARK